jgi:hypothetical protein
MSFIDVMIFSFGLFVTAATIAGAFLIGLAEAGDPEHSRTEDLTELEKKLVDRGSGT